MKKNSFFSKLFLVSILAISLAFIGCGESNPTTTDPGTTQPQNVDTSKKFIVHGNVNSNGAVLNNAAQLVVTLTNKGSGETISRSGADVRNGNFAFQGVQPGVYEIEAKDKANLYETTAIFEYMDAMKELNISMQPLTTTSGPAAIILINFQGELVDSVLGKPIPFADVVAKKNTQEVITTTEFNNGKYSLKGLSSGTYSITYSKDSFKENTSNLIIGDDKITFDGNIIALNSIQSGLVDSAGNTFKGYKLPKKNISPLFYETGSIGGVLSKDGVIKKGTSFKLYRRESPSASSLPSLIMTLTSGASDGYFLVKNIQSGYYTAVVAGTTYTSTSTPAGTEYTFAEVYFENIEVVSNSMTPVPSTGE